MGERKVAGVVDFAQYELWSVDEFGVRSRLFARLEPEVGFPAAVKSARSLVALGPLKAAQVVATARGLGKMPEVVCTVRVNAFEAGPTCDMTRRLVLLQEFAPDNFLGYTWRGEDVRGGFFANYPTEEQVAQLAEECRGVSYLCDEDDFESLASDMEEGESAFTVQNMSGEEWFCDTAATALDTARRECSYHYNREQEGAVLILKDVRLVLKVWKGGHECDFSESAFKGQPEEAEFLDLIKEGK